MTAVPPLELLPLGPPFVPDPVVRDLAERLSRFLGDRVTVSAPSAPPDSARLPDGTLASSALVDALIDRSGPDPDPRLRWTIAIVAADLAAADRPYVFGEATVGGAWAVVSTARLADAAPARATDRLEKEVIHELGHLAGLGHCADPGCVMTASLTLRDVDRKSSRFCNPCHGRFFAGE